MGLGQSERSLPLDECGWVLETEFATTSVRQRERAPCGSELQWRLSEVCTQISDRLSGDQYPRPTRRPSARFHDDLHVAAEEHEKPHEPVE